MPQHILPIEEIDESIIRPVVFKVTKDIIERMELPADMPVLFKGKANQFIYVGSEFDDKDYLGGHNRYGVDPITYIETLIEDTEYRLLSTPVLQAEEVPIFHDRCLGVYLKPGMVSKKIDITIKITGTENQVERWRTGIRRKVAQGVIDLTHVVDYHYPIQNYYMYLLVDIFNKRNKVAGYNDTLRDYFDDNFIKQFRTVTNPAGNGLLYVVAETQLPIYGWFDFGTRPPVPIKESDAGLFSFEFVYSFYFDCPETIIAKTPIQVHNQLLDDRFIKSHRVSQVIDLITRYGSLSNEAFLSFSKPSAFEHRLNQHPGLPLPFIDDWLDDKFKPDSYTGLTRSLISLNPADKKDITNLSNYSDTWKFNQVVLNYMQGMGSKMFTQYQSLFLVQLYRWDEITDPSNLVIDSELNLRSVTDLSLRDNYHMVVSVLYDLTQLSTEAFRSLLNYPCMFKYMIYLLCPAVFNKYGLNLTTCMVDPVDGNAEDPIDYDTAMGIIRDTTKCFSLKNTSGYTLWNLVGQFGITATKQST